MTSKPKHTGGTWEWVPGGNTPFVQVKGRFPHGFICNVESLNAVEDAKLIAAAPSMLAALKAILDDMGHFPEVSESIFHSLNLADEAIKGFEDE